MASYMQTTTVLLVVIALLIGLYGAAKNVCDYEVNSITGHNLHVNYMTNLDVKGNFDGQTVTVDNPKTIIHLVTIRGGKLARTPEKNKKKGEGADRNLEVPRQEENDKLYNKVMETGKKENDKKVKAAPKSEKPNVVIYKADVKNGDETIGMMKYTTQVKDGKKVYEKALYSKFDIEEKTQKKNTPKNKNTHKNKNTPEKKNTPNKKPPVLKHGRQTNYQDDGVKIKSTSIGTAFMKGGKLAYVVYESVIYQANGKVNNKCPKVRSLFNAVN